MQDLKSALKRFFGHDVFRPLQEQIIAEVLNNRDLLVIMPTGGGKSLCYQLPALLKPGLTLVVSPLISLMQDQVNALKDRGIGATFLNSSLNSQEIQSRSREILQGNIKLLYVAPERLLSEGFSVFLTQIQQDVGISALAIDEAHCVSEWGQDFRPEYRQIKGLRQRYPQVPMVALTATATTRVRQDIIQQLGLIKPGVYVDSFNRPNLYYEVVSKDKRDYPQLLKYIKLQQGSGIVYCLSRRRVEEVASRLQADGISSLPYHGGMDDTVRSVYQNRFIGDDVRVMVATIAFGMGINKPDVRFVFHYDLPRNLESYYQEVGRAGRDGERAICVLFFSRGDIRTIDYLIKQKSDPSAQRLARQGLSSMVDYAESTVCRRKIQLSYFGERFSGSCQNCDNCLNPKPQEDWTIEAQKFLSCVARCQERFGMNHIIDVLRGSRKEKIERYGHHLLSTYGIGKDISSEAWKRLGRSLLDQGLVNATNDDYAILKLNKLSWEILRNSRRVSVAVATPKAEKQQTKDIESEFLWLQLRQLRQKLADRLGIPPYSIISDSTLKVLSQRQPTTKAQLGQISGLNQSKIAQYGDLFLEEIKAFLASTHLPEQLPSPTQIATLELHQQGLSVKAIARERNLTTSTIYRHLAELISLNRPVNLDSLVLPSKQAAIKAALLKWGATNLTPVKAYLGEDYTYSEIQLVRAWLQKKS
ncbi:DNA helicase RecQ [Gloeocapsa sp. PCC 73106]|uniref:DNA helicase RecQ n=1 Tax=Gloeocapsa sp. PCC 73106 TaxID=102232 RepID=UPI0002ABCF9D|nr:DNA helicase RecQ [Gloeocapsa sp. PCC 73106]ELR97579.1 ATP-dependent DNA helicase RecQ [Gloeocapsa sp. PCC 73106]